MMIQIHNERSNVIGLDRSLELNWRWWGWIKNEEMREITKRSWKNMFFNFTWPCEIFAQSCKMLQKDENEADGFSTSHHLVKLLRLVRKCIFSRFLNEEASGRPLRWCQVSSWPWPINRNMIDSFKKLFYIFLILKLFRFLFSLYNSLLSFIFSIAKHVLWDQISKHE